MNPITLWRSSRLKRAAALLVLLACLAGASRLFGQDGAFTEYQIKALYLMNFTKYVDWPDSAFATTNSPIVIGVLGENKFGDDLQKVVAGCNVNGRPLVIRQLENTNDLRQCQILFISASAKTRLGELLPGLQTAPVLTVGEADQFTARGGMINFARKGVRLRLAINLPAAQKAGLRISAKLLAIADVMDGQPP